jgi:hypothetical protein
MEITITKVATKIRWYMLNYPESTVSYYELQTESGEMISNGNMTIPQEVIAIWGTDDNVIENYIISQLNINNNEISLPEEPTLLPTEPTEIILEEESIPLGSDL